MLQIKKSDRNVFVPFIVWILADVAIAGGVYFPFLILLFAPWMLFKLKFHETVKFAAVPTAHFLILFNFPISGLLMYLYVGIVFLYFLSVMNLQRPGTENINFSDEKPNVKNAFVPYLFLIETFLILVILYFYSFGPEMLLFSAFVVAATFSVWRKAAYFGTSHFRYYMLTIFYVFVMLVGFYSAFTCKSLLWSSFFGASLFMIVLWFGFYDLKPPKLKKR